MYRISNKELDALDSKLLRYKSIDSEINLRRQELMSKDNSDCNIGGGRSNRISKPVEDITVKILSDIKIRNLELFKETVQEFIQGLDREQLEIFNLRWVNSSSTYYYTWEEIGDMLHVSRKTIYRKRRVILEKFAYLQ